MNDFQFGVVLLNYTSFGDTIKVVESLVQQTVSNSLKIIVVDNASPNESFVRLQDLKSRFNNVEVLQTGENLGYAKGNNFGLLYLDAIKEIEYVAILNNDIILPNDCLEVLASRYRSLDNPCIIAPVMVSENGERSYPMRLNSFFDDLCCLFAIYRYLSPKQSHVFPLAAGKQEVAVDLVPGSFMFTRLETFKSIGFFFPGTFLYAEERFVHIAAIRAGLKNYIVLDLEYIHAHRSPTITQTFGSVGKYRLLYKSIVEFTRVCRNQGQIKATLFSIACKYSLFELMTIEFCKSIIRNCKKRA